VAAKPDQGVLADPAAVPVGDHIGLLGQRAQRRPVPFGPDRDDLAVVRRTWARRIGSQAANAASSSAS
jgi:hypothetical protein